MDYENDISTQAATDAHRGTSFAPEKRAEQVRTEYANILRGDHERLSELADTDEKKAQLAEEFSRYRAGYKARTLAWLGARSRCMSTMITGPANFPTARNQKRGDVADRRGRELSEFRERALKAIRKTLCPELAPIMTGDADAGERLADKIAEAEKRRDDMKTDNATARKLGQPMPYYSFTLTNLGANIRRMKQRAAHVEKLQAIPATTAQGTAARIEDAPQDNRIRLFFPGKPADDVRAELKRRGFRWTPSLGCWQAYRNNWSMDAARTLAGLAQAPARAPEPAPVDNVCPDGPSCPDTKCQAERAKGSTFAARIADTSKTPLHHQFIEWVRAVAALNGKSDDEIYAAWLEHSETNRNMDQSPTKYEFCMWRGLKDPEREA